MLPVPISASRLVRRFGAVVALDQVDLEVHAGEVVLLLGANGAGKTTLVRTLAGLVRPHRGTVLMAGFDPARDVAARRQIGFLSHAAMLYEDLTPRENLGFTAALHQLDDPDRRIAAALENAQLDHRADRPIRGFSRGMLQRLALARATLHDPAILLLDEPFTGLDALASRGLATRIAAAAEQGRTVVAVTHDPRELWSAATRVVVLQGGRKVMDLPRPDDPGSISLEPQPELAA